MSYITFKTIGEAGNLGSQLQQYASLCAVARESGKQIVFPESSLQKGYGFKFAELVNVDIEVRPDSFFENFVDIRPDDSLRVDPKVFNLHPDVNYNVVNRFDLFHYWHPAIQESVLNWNWNSEHYSAAQEGYNTFKLRDKETVAIHVRRGDYLLPQHDHFCQLDHEYYTTALGYFFQDVERFQFVVFSNDIEWCKENLIEESEIVTFIEPGSDFSDLILMSLCDHQITANSSYSWWAAYKNKNTQKKVICPTNYLKKRSPWSHINGQYYPHEWININNKS